MRAINSVGLLLPRTALFLILLSGVVQSSSAQTVTPVVSIQATDFKATWSGDPGAFTVSRIGNSNTAVLVFYTITGTASNGVDYTTIPNTVMLPIGVTSTSIVVQPINLGQTDIKTVVLDLVASPLANPLADYLIGLPKSATVYITPDTVTNLPPVVNIVAPANGASFVPPANIPIIALASDPDGFATRVEFFAGQRSLGVVTNWVVVDPGPGGPPPRGTRAFFLTWSNVPAGNYQLTAKATDDGGAATVSSPVEVLVQSVTAPPLVVRIISPPNGAVFHAPLDLPIFAYARATSGPVASVEFFADSNSLGLGQPVAVSTTPITSSNIFALVWSNAPAGVFALTAKATDTDGASAVSVPVHVTILPEGPPPTNRPPIVSIVATDPVAIEGTNCWPWLGLFGVPPTWDNWAASSALCRFFTNCGPKNAMFMVRRFGDTNDDVSVVYNIAGTASNGVDYVTLPGSLTIPAGQRAGLITVVPLDDGPPDRTSTVILRLAPSTNYFLGFPRAAAAIILDGVTPRPTSNMLPDRSFHLGTTGPDGAWFHVDFSSDLINWTPICTNQVINGSIDFVDPDTQFDQMRFYRAVPQAAPGP